MEALIWIVVLMLIVLAPLRFVFEKDPYITLALTVSAFTVWIIALMVRLLIILLHQ